MIENVSSVSSSIDWSSFIPDIIATFFGFGLAILGEHIYDCIKDSREKNRLISSLKTELKMVKKTLNDIEKESKESRWVNPIKTPVWDSAISADKISLIDSQIWFKTLCNLYDNIKVYNEWHTTRTNMLYFSSDNKTTPKEISEAINDTKNDITKLITTLENTMDIK